MIENIAQNIEQMLLKDSGRFWWGKKTQNERNWEEEFELGRDYMIFDIWSLNSFDLMGIWKEQLDWMDRRDRFRWENVVLSLNKYESGERS